MKKISELKKNLGLAASLIVIAIIISLVYSLIAQAQSQPPSIPHGDKGFENCVSCHGERGMKPSPSDHTSYPEGSCLSCHSYVSQSTPAPIEQTTASNECLSCHGQPGLEMKLADGEMLNLFVDSEVFAASVHGGKLLCIDCHTSIPGYPHEKIDAESLREYSIGQYELCKQCHFANYNKTLDSVHFKVLSEGGENAPLCTDCHGAHNVSPPDEPRAKISTTCSTCHPEIVDQYVTSVHGKALIEEDNYDVPVCTDCHPSHTLEDPRTAAFRIQSVDICSNCHSNEKLMQKYNISTNVVQSYLQDFHGATVALVSKQNKDIWVETAVCTDCHGVHDIKMVDDPDSPLIKANLVSVCAQCHPDANTNFPGAWLSHYSPSVTKAPLVFGVQWFYRIMIPFIIVGLGAHILLDLWRALTNR